MISYVKQINLVLCLVATVLLTACLNSNDSETILTNYGNATVKSMTLTNNSNVCSNLSGYSFTIDNNGQSDPELIDAWKDVLYGRLTDNEKEYTLQPGIIFNPDSLPKGSIADSIKVNLNYNTPSSVKFLQYDKDRSLCKVVNFTDTQTVWFDDYAVTILELVARDGYTRKDYFVKINIHDAVCDTICWQTLTEAAFDASDISSQRVDTIGNDLCWFVTKTDGTQQIRKADLNGDVTMWSDPQVVTAPSAIDLSTLYNWNNSLYAVATDKSLLTSTDGIQWSVSSSDYQFVSILGVQMGKYNTRTQSFEPDSINAIITDGTAYHFANSANGMTWQLNNVNLDGTSLVPEDFPIKGFTRPISIAARPHSGNTTSRLYVVGGEKADGSLSSSTWTCDGHSWAEFPQLALPAMKGASIAQYTKDADHPGSLWILHPGIMADGKVSRKLYFSENSGVTWKVAGSEFSELADTTPLASAACNSTFVAPKNWKIYFLGGTDSEGIQQTCICTGQLPNLTFSIKR